MISRVKESKILCQIVSALDQEIQPPIPVILLSLGDCLSSKCFRLSGVGIITQESTKWVDLETSAGECKSTQFSFSHDAVDRISWVADRTIAPQGLDN